MQHLASHASNGGGRCAWNPECRRACATATASPVRAPDERAGAASRLRWSASLPAGAPERQRVRGVRPGRGRSSARRHWRGGCATASAATPSISPARRRLRAAVSLRRLFQGKPDQLLGHAMEALREARVARPASVQCRRCWTPRRPPAGVVARGDRPRRPAPRVPAHGRGRRRRAAQFQVPAAAARRRPARCIPRARCCRWPKPTDWCPTSTRAVLRARSRNLGERGADAPPVRLFVCIRRARSPTATTLPGCTGRSKRYRGRRFANGHRPAPGRCAGAPEELAPSSGAADAGIGVGACLSQYLNPAAKPTCCSRLPLGYLRLSPLYRRRRQPPPSATRRGMIHAPMRLGLAVIGPVCRGSTRRGVVDGRHRFHPGNLGAGTRARPQFRFPTTPGALRRCSNAAGAGDDPGWRSGARRRRRRVRASVGSIRPACGPLAGSRWRCLLALFAIAPALRHPRTRTRRQASIQERHGRGN